MANDESEREVCYRQQDFDGACSNSSAEYTHNGKHYCVLHFPSEDKAEDFCQAVEEKLAARNSVDLRGVWVPARYYALFKGYTFPSAIDFSNAIFRGSADFFGATFCSWVTFRTAQYLQAVDLSAEFCETATFDHAIFHGNVRFHDAQFLGSVAVFRQTLFCKDVNFEDTRFDKGANFSRATFCANAVFDGSEFCRDVTFTRAEFKAHTVFRTTEQKEILRLENRLDLRDITLEEQAKFSFDSVTLRPNWFVGVSPREFSFNNVEWYKLDSWRRTQKVEAELKSLS
jgi:uncharacterized protein YjbI with pentapeptide repeats